MKLLQPAGETPNNVTATILKTRKHFFSIFGDNFKFWWSSERFLLQRFSFFFEVRQGNPKTAWINLPSLKIQMEDCLSR